MAYDWIKETVCNVSAIPPEGLCFTPGPTLAPTTAAPTASPTYMPSYMPSRNPTHRPPTLAPSVIPSIQPSTSSTTALPTKAKPPPLKKDALKSPDERTFDVDSANDSNSSSRRTYYFLNSAIISLAAGVLLSSCV